MREITLISPQAQDFISGLVSRSEPMDGPHSLKVSSLILLVTAGLTSCGRTDSPSPPQKPILPILAVREAPQDYTLADPGCQEDSGEHRLSTAAIGAWHGDEVGQHSVPLKDTFTRRSLVNSAISRTTFDEVQERWCDGSVGPSQVCLDKNLREPSWDTVRPAKDLRICRDGYEFGRQTYEGVALTSAFYIQKARERYLSVAGNEKVPDLIVLSVLPHLTDYYVTQNLQGQSVQIKRYMTHNLAYFPDRETIVVFPESKKRAETAQGYLWESAFALAHEYGHHIDFERHGFAYREGGLLYDPVLHAFLEWDPTVAEESHRDHVALLQNDSLLRPIQSRRPAHHFHSAAGNGQYLGAFGLYESRRSLLGSALAEGFADLLAYYTDGASGQSVVGLPGIGRNRDVGSRYFGDGRPKVLTDEHLQVFFREKVERDSLAYYSRFSDVHTVGAVIAFAADQIFSRILNTYSSNSREPNDIVGQRYLLALLWMDRVTASLANLAPNADRKDLARSISQGFESTMSRHLSSFPLDSRDSNSASDELKRDLCLTFEAILPGLGPLPFADAREGCPL